MTDIGAEEDKDPDIELFVKVGLLVCACVYHKMALDEFSSQL